MLRIPHKLEEKHLEGIHIVSGIGGFAGKIAAGNRKKMTQSAAVGIDGSWNHRRNGMPPANPRK
jgi:hypothetical protein